MHALVVHKRNPHDVYIGRPSKWGNPFSHKDVPGTTRVATREAAVEAYRKHLWEQIKNGDVTLEELAALDRKTLGCWCAPELCHGEVLATAAVWATVQLLKAKYPNITTKGA